MASFDPFDSSPPTASAPAASLSFNTQEWTEHVDPTSGKTYYSNTRTGETSWESPYQTQPIQQETAIDFFADPPQAQTTPTVIRKPSFDNDNTNSVSVSVPPAEGMLKKPSSNFEGTTTQPAERLVAPPSSLVKQPSATNGSFNSSAAPQQAVSSQSQGGVVTIASLLNGKVHGECLARISTYAVITKSWKPCFWVFDTPSTMLVFKEKASYLDYKANPYLNQSEKDFLVKKKVDFTQPFKCYPVSQKSYGFSSSHSLYQFKLEEYTDLGPATIKFGSENHALLDEMRGAINEKIQKRRHSVSGSVGGGGGGGGGGNSGSGFAPVRRDSH